MPTRQASLCRWTSASLGRLFDRPEASARNGSPDPRQRAEAVNDEFPDVFDRSAAHLQQDVPFARNDMNIEHAVQLGDLLGQLALGDGGAGEEGDKHEGRGGETKPIVGEACGILLNDAATFQLADAILNGRARHGHGIGQLHDALPGVALQQAKNGTIFRIHAGILTEPAPIYPHWPAKCQHNRQIVYLGSDGPAGAEGSSFNEPA